MGKIIILDENTANKIAAGEVIERPASVVKELVENSIDAGATNINVEIRNGGISFIRVIDNGSGLAEDDVQMAFERHATSKIRKAADLDSITSMGFRGEALASIAAVSSVRLVTRSEKAVQGVSIEVKGGSVLDIKSAGCPIGTSITVRELFFNTPARYKFLKKDSTEAGYAADVINRIALGYPEISFKLISNGSVLLQTPGNGDLKSAIFCVYGAETARHLIDLNYDDGNVKISGYIGKAEISRSSRAQQSVYINRRFIRSKTITTALDAAYETFLMKNRYAFAVMDIRLNPSMIDVNVHPSKMEVKFSNEKDVYRVVYHAVNSALLSQSSIRTLPDSGKFDKNFFNIGEDAREEPVYRQHEIDLPGNEISRNTVAPVVAVTVAESEKEYIQPKEADNSEQYDTHDRPVNPPAEALPLPGLFEGVRVIGQAFSTYILLERGDELFLIDQHAAHERIRYEELKAAFSRGEPVCQTLLAVIPVELTGGEYQFAINEASYFEKLGFFYESFGTNSVILRSVPYAEKGLDIKAMFLEVLDLVMNGTNTQRSAITDKVLYSMACKTAVKAHKRLDDKEVEALLRRMELLENPYTCPHGRPAILKLKRYELEKLFKRIV